MNRYERAFEPDWDTLDEDEAMRRAYALGVAASLEEYHPEEFDAIRAEMNTAYSRSVVELAFEEGKNEGRELSRRLDDSDAADVWENLIEAGDIEIPDRSPTGGRLGLPEAMDRISALDQPDLDSTEAMEFPEFLEKD